MARPTKLTPARQKDIEEAILAGNYFGAACEYAGIDERTGYNWMARGRDELARRENPRVKEGTAQWEKEEDFVQFFQTITRASARVEVRVVAKIQQAGDEDWRALAWFMEHRYPTKWGKHVNEHTGKDGKAIIIQTAQNMDEL